MTAQDTPAAVVDGGNRTTRPVWPQRLVWGGFGGLVILGSVLLGLGSPQQPGPGFWPFAAGAIILVAAFAIRPPVGDQPPEEVFSHNPRRLLTALVSMVVFTALFSVVGLVLPVFALQLLWLRVLAGMRWWTALLLSVAVTAFLTAGLVYGLNIPLPPDPIIALLKGTS
jgi:hypothetical protein